MALDVDAKPHERSGGVLRQLVRYLDVPLVVVALAVGLAMNAPRLGLALGVSGWLVQRVIGEADRRLIRRVTKPLRQLGVTLFEGFARIWLLAGFILVAALVGGRRDGLTASLVILGAYSVAFVIKLFTGPRRKAAVQ